jgi:hypothetical protein
MVGLTCLQQNNLLLQSSGVARSDVGHVGHRRPADAARGRGGAAVATAAASGRAGSKPVLERRDFGILCRQPGIIYRQLLLLV